MRSSSFHFLESGIKNSQPILFLHGFMGSSQDWLPIMHALSSEFYCLAIDLPGHGKTVLTERKKIHGMREIGKRILCLIEELEICHPNLIGYSLGGRLALFLALNFNQTFKKVILESSSPGLKSDYEKKKRLSHDILIAQKLLTINFENFLFQWYNQSIFDTLRSHKNYKKLFQQRLKNNPYALAKILISLSSGAQPSLWSPLKENKIPLLLLTGAYDIKFNKIAEEMTKISPAIKHKNVEGAGHNIHFEKPVKFVREVRDFLSME